VVIDFNVLGQDGTGDVTVGSPYAEDGFLLIADTGAFSVWENQNPNQPGSPAVIDLGAAGIIMSQTPSFSFDAVSIDLCEATTTSAANTVDFLAEYSAGGTVAASFTVDGVFGCETFNFPGTFTGLETLAWDDRAAPFPDFVQYDNIVVVPGTP
jgi:hypothetical protein